MSSPNPYESPQTPPPPVRRQADAQAFGKVLALVSGVIVFALCAGGGVRVIWLLRWLALGPPD